MDVQKKLDEIVDAVGNARSMPMSASCVVNRGELLSLLEEVREALPGSLAQAQELLGGHEQLSEQARQEAERIVAAAHTERSTLISDTAIARTAQEEADRILAEARRDAEEIRAEADDYVDSKLANFEVVLNKTIGSVDRGREKLLGRGPGLDEEGYADEDAPEYSADPDTLIRRADDYVDAKLGAFEAVLSKTLDAVGRGRQKLHGRVATDDLGLHMAEQDAAGRQGHTSDADYLSGLAELSGEQPLQGAGAAAHRPMEPQSPPRVPEQPVQIPIPAQAQSPQQYADPAAQQQYADPSYSGYQQQDAYAYQQQDPYAYQQAQQPVYDPAAYDPSYSQGYGQNYDQAAQGWQQHPEAQGQQQSHQQQGQDPQGALDETSLFDTSMIDLEQLRRYEQGR
ncbi:cell division initiation protein [Streptomyces sp. NP-1717]|uniref:cell division initiation protein n=1 Tax=Streptomyces sp. NP-1717 TaxID=2704470 RepID=UPI001F5E25CC|nr:cell division initiation protein [Streptomyces sp. NP-1717]MCI3224379.1 cell division initiation protein [Streptomyces sp. NP-1717]